MHIILLFPTRRVREALDGQTLSAPLSVERKLKIDWLACSCWKGETPPKKTETDRERESEMADARLACFLFVFPLIAFCFPKSNILERRTESCSNQPTRGNDNCGFELVFTWRRIIWQQFFFFFFSSTISLRLSHLRIHNDNL